MWSVSLQSRVNPFYHVIADIRREPLDINIALDILKPECPLSFSFLFSPQDGLRSCHSSAGLQTELSQESPLRNLFMLIMSSVERIEMLIHGDESSGAAHESKNMLL